MAQTQMENPIVTLKDAALFLGSIVLNGLSIVTKSNISFVLGSTVSVLAIIHYIIQIRKNSKKES